MIKTPVTAMALALALAIPAMAQTGTAPVPPRTTTAPAQPPAVASPPALTQQGTAPAAPTAPRAATTLPTPGANSFTEAQTRSRMEAAGFSVVTNLRKDAQGIWHAQAQRAGQPVSVSMDFQGDVTGR